MKETRTRTRAFCRQEAKTLAFLRRPLLVAAALSAASLPAMGYDFAAGNDEGVVIYYNISSASQAQVTYPGGYSSEAYSGRVEIPATVEYGGTEYSVASVGSRAFYECPKLESVVIPEGAASIGSWAFCYCFALTSVELPQSLASIGECAFGGCVALKSIELPQGVVTIGDYSFCDCSILASIEVPSSTVYVGEHAFESCYSLKSVTLGESVSYIGERAFQGCSRLQEINSLNPDPPTAYRNPFANVSKYSCVLNVPAGSKEKYSQAQYWREFYNIVETDFGGIEGIEADSPEVT
ncbi:MAG: leucine-rich repeat domain-containing protein, partial [Clostridia bacterium]|nr:leucine-rich repeat domain-containing protein [Clostridia bacterium]